jgi:hypothetical protein
MFQYALAFREITFSLPLPSLASLATYSTAYIGISLSLIYEGKKRADKVSSSLCSAIASTIYKMPFALLSFSALSIIINLEIIHELISISFYWQFFVFVQLSKNSLSLSLLLGLSRFFSFAVYFLFAAALPSFRPVVRRLS